MPLPPRVSKWLKRLKKDFPLGFPVYVRTKKNLKCSRVPVHGYAVKENGVGRIYLDRKDGSPMAESTMIDYLFHEYCHLYTETVEGEHDDEHHHGDAFWLQLGEMSRFYENYKE